jgi:hypothetical protein
MEAIVFKVLAIVLGAMLGIIGFFTAYFFKRLMDSTDELNQSVGRLDNSITGMNGIILANDDKFITYRQEHEKDHGAVERKLNKHSESILYHEKEIIRLKEKTLGT